MKTIGLVMVAVLAGCGGGGGHSDAPPPPPDASMIDGAPGPDAACFTNPTTHHEIINACTDPGGVKIDKRPDLPLLEPDGTLPPLPPCSDARWQGPWC